MENVENTVNPTETAPKTAVDSGENEEVVTIYREGDGENSGGDGDGASVCDGCEEEFSDCDGEYDEEAELSELCRISGVEYGSLSEFSGYERYLELKGSGILTAEEAFYAVKGG